MVTNELKDSVKPRLGVKLKLLALVLLAFSLQVFLLELV